MRDFGSLLRNLDCLREEQFVCRIQMLQNGGWEHTSAILQPFPGFEPTEDYEEYSADFFDGKHNVLKGSSPYTHPSAIRNSFRNFYQDNYPHAFAKFRCCR